MEINNRVRKIIFIIVGLVVLSGLGAAVASMVMKNKVQPAPEQGLKIDKKQLPQEEIPAKLPVNLPMEKGVKVLQNFTSTTNDGRSQSTRAYETSRSLADNLTLFSKYLKANGWTGIATVDNEKYKMVAGKKGRERLHIEMNTDPETQARTVTISLTELPE